MYIVIINYKQGGKGDIIKDKIKCKMFPDIASISLIKSGPIVGNLGGVWLEK